MIRRPPRSTLSSSSAASDVYKRQSREVKPASRSARAISTRWFGAPSPISHLLDIRPAEQALRQEDQCDGEHGKGGDVLVVLSLIHISEPTRLLSISYAVFCLKKKKQHSK